MAGVEYQKKTSYNLQYWYGNKVYFSHDEILNNKLLEFIITLRKHGSAFKQ